MFDAAIYQVIKDSTKQGPDSSKEADPEYLKVRRRPQERADNWAQRILADRTKRARELQHKSVRARRRRKQ